MKLIDTHIHVWDFSKASYDWLQQADPLLNRNYAIEELQPQLADAGVTAGILVQAAWNLADTEWMLEVARRTPWIKGVVGWLPLTDPIATKALLEEKYLADPYFKGVRHLIHDEANTRWLLQDTVIESLHILAAHNIPYDIVGILPEHIEAAIEVAKRVPQLRMVFDHMNQPPVATKEWFGRWGTLMEAAAACDRLFVKISGLGTTARNPQWQPEDIAPYVSFVLQHFGADRCFMGGDWPVSLLAGSYASTWEKYRQTLMLVTDAATREKIFSLNAERFYHL